ncbi:putative F420-dependent oxidoreductase [Streptomyces sp. SAI-117]|jgi:probable F420-dependent oxidoreductase|uniref:LLM class F420-dependent oxidoreductase n=1 Tax=Streptomyces sp. SAI-117 TaxID=2940546 RepID=UPI00247461BD|nr:LLM class F420-dependent oxidoreductase [Streptomyces sp. SAI-117]MDH6570096.1 putative F420-dependent oxidoreductase [Streptomyces sp. SAI-117]
MKEIIGKYGIWNGGGLRAEDPSRRGERAEAAAELEELGFGAIWLGGSSSAANAAPLLEATSRVVVGTSIQSIWDHEAEAAAVSHTDLNAAHSGRFVLGLGVSHAKLAEQYRRPYSALVSYLDALDGAGAPAEGRVLAALGPRTIELARDRAAGSIPYLITADQTARSRELLGDTPLLAPELKVVLESDPARARTLARDCLAIYLGLPNYTDNFLRNGFTEDDFKDGGSDRLVDAVFAWGSDDRIRARVDEFIAAGADHVALQVVDGGTRYDLPRQAWRRLAALLA